MQTEILCKLILSDQYTNNWIQDDCFDTEILISDKEKSYFICEIHLKLCIFANKI